MRHVCRAFLLGWCLMSGAVAPADDATTATAPAEASRQQSAPAERSVVTQGGLHFNVPPDWPMEKHGAAIGPIAVEDYVVRKFTTLEARLMSNEQRLSALEQRCKALESALPRNDAKLRSVPSTDKAARAPLQETTTPARSAGVAAQPPALQSAAAQSAATPPTAVPDHASTHAEPESARAN